MDTVLWLGLFVVLIGCKVWLMRAVWRMAQAQGKSRWLCLTASFFFAWIVYLALRMNAHTRRVYQQDEVR